MSKNYYEILGVTPTISQSLLKKVFRHLISQKHPDKNPGNEQIYQEFLLINEAFDVLKDPQKRHEYDYHNRTQSDSQWSMQPNSEHKMSHGVFIDKVWDIGANYNPMSDIMEGEDLFIKRKMEFNATHQEHP
jgi:DnaJ-class molecular chaperone